MKYLSLFSGYGGFELGIQQAYEELCIKDISSESQWEKEDKATGGPQGQCGEQPDAPPVRLTCIGFSEIDKYAIQVYKKHFKYEQCEYCKSRESIQGTEWGGIRPIGDKPDIEVGSDEQSETRRDRELKQSQNNCQCKHKHYGDITKLDPKELPDFDLLTGGFPCQAFSIAGKRAGFEDTRGTLIFDVFRILKEKQPRLVLLENVKGLLSHDNGRTFKTIITSLNELGYAVEWQVLNAKNFGVPQNRERVFIVGHLGGFGGRQVFPIGQWNDEVSGEIRVKPRKQGVQVSYRVGIEKRNISSTLDTMYHKGLPAKGQPRMGVFEKARIRRLTPTECERLMGLPDGWTAEGTEGKISDTQRYKLCGNGVVVNVVEEIIKRLLN